VHGFSRCSFLGIFPFTAPYLPWVLLGFSMLLGSGGVLVDAIGIAVGHVYYFLEDVFPVVSDSRRWRFRRPLKTPSLLYVVIMPERAQTACASCYVWVQLLHAVPMVYVRVVAVHRVCITSLSFICGLVNTHTHTHAVHPCSHALCGTQAERPQFAMNNEPVGVPNDGNGGADNINGQQQQQQQGNAGQPDDGNDQAAVGGPGMW
jgi:hypothetical protein